MTGAHSVTVATMRTRVHLRPPWGETVVRDIVDQRWASPHGVPDQNIGEGLWALPGLVDAHAHLAVEALTYQPGVLKDALERARRALEAGVTLILDKGWCDTTTIQVIEKLSPEERPEIEAAGRIIAVPEGYYPDFAVEVDPALLERHVTEAAAEGAGWVKLIGDWPRRGRGPVANFTTEELRAAVEVAESAGARVAIHTMARDVPSSAVAAGVHSIEHGLFLTEEDLEVLAGRQGMWVPTVRRVKLVIEQLGAASSGGRLLSEGLENVRRLLPVAVEAGVCVLAGTDLAGPSAEVASEAIELGEYGLSTSQVVRAVSLAGFAATGRSDRFEPGATADAVLFPENPLTDPAVLARPRRVIRKGTVR